MQRATQISSTSRALCSRAWAMACQNVMGFSGSNGTFWKAYYRRTLRPPGVCFGTKHLLVGGCLYFTQLGTWMTSG